ncbi:uncharacterized protein LOC134743163 isoform X4 [Cydia strobilella]|uniref:uncharacterized protein LOC134743163 isoform X4 n=1 Tax=Cydia strobilella TaxID=1100964 RepID=UPI00300545AA
MLETSKNTLEELEIRQLKNRRGVCKRKLTVFNKFIERIDSSALTAEIIVDISLRLEQLPKLYNDFSEIQDRIETLCSDEGDIEAHEAERMSFEDTFYRLSAKGKLLAKVDTDSTPNDHSPRAPPQQPLGESIKYPEISLPSFDGDLTQWLQFRDTFDALVNQASLAPIVKYKYLRSCLQDGALEVISSLDFSEDAYMLAWQMLCERYNNPKRLVTNHMRALFDVEPVPSTPSGLRGLESANFLAALRRFIARRGKPKELVSDNSTTFHGASNELKDLQKYLQDSSSELVSHCADEGIKWSFIPVYTPHMGSLWESSIKLTKYHLKRVLGLSLLTYEQFVSILYQVESMVNSRPLCPLPSSNPDYPVLTPAHFLIGKAPNSLPDEDYNHVPKNRLTHYQLLQQITQDFWRRWSRDYIGTLQERTKWRSARGPSLAVDTVVLVRDERLPPCRWRLGKIVATQPGRDGVTRVAVIRTARGDIQRASITFVHYLLRVKSYK